MAIKFNAVKVVSMEISWLWGLVEKLNMETYLVEQLLWILAYEILKASTIQYQIFVRVLMLKFGILII